MKLLIKNILVGIAVIPLFFHMEDFGVIFYFGFHLYQLYIYGHLLLELEVGYTSVMVGVQ